MKVKFEATLQVNNAKKEYMVCLDITEDIQKYAYLYPDNYIEYIERKIERDLYKRYKINICRCKENNCGCWSSEITAVALDSTSKNAIIHMIMTRRC